jgi:multidrug transporter EmrE-like cation transporter
MDVLNARWFAWLLVAGAGLNTCLGNLMLKQSRLTAQPGLWGMVTSPWFLGGLFFYGLNVLLFAKALDKLPVSVAYPAFAGLGFFLLAVFSRIMFGESMTNINLAGIVLILVGLACLAVKP